MSLARIKLAADDTPIANPLAVDRVYQGDCRNLLERVQTNSVALSVWSPPYFVGKSYERDLTFEGWKALLAQTIAKHFRVLRPGGFLAINIADILCFADPSLPRIQAQNLTGTRLPVTREQILEVMAKHRTTNRHEVAKLMGVSEQTIDRRLKNNNVRGGKHQVQTRTLLVGGFLEEVAYGVGLYLYDRRIWKKDPAWQNSRWHTNSYRAVDEFEYIYLFWKPGITNVDRDRLERSEWVEWGSRAVWEFPSVRANDDHEAKFPIELPRRLIRLLTDPNDLVLDCFLGSGTTALAAIECDRHFLGFEKEPRYADLAREAIRTMKRESLFQSRRG